MNPGNNQNIILLTAFILLAVISGKSQCFPDRHSTNFFDGWVSCELAVSPNPVRGKSHFIMYDYGRPFKLGQMTVWNSNDPAHLDWGMQDIAIDYSLDGETWVEAGQFTLPQASGLNTYEGAEGPHLNEIEARYLLITGLSNYGGDCFGLSEVKVEGELVIISNVEDVVTLECVGVSIYPNPFVEKVTLALSPGCTGDVDVTVFDASGKVVSKHSANLVKGQEKSLEIGQDLPAGAYNLYIQFGGKGMQQSIVKINRT